jgi:AcrR family transcriptional regulator
MIARHGIHGLRVEEVAEQAGVATSLLYYYFKDRSGLIREAFEYASEKAPSTALRLASDTRSGYEALEAALLAELDDDSEQRNYAIVWGEACTVAVFEPELRATAQRITRSWQATVAGGISRGVSDGSIRPDIDPETTADLLITLIEGLSVRWLAGTMELEAARELLGAKLSELKA